MVPEGGETINGEVVNISVRMSGYDDVTLLRQRDRGRNYDKVVRANKQSVYITNERRVSIH